MAEYALSSDKGGDLSNFILDDIQSSTSAFMHRAGDSSGVVDSSAAVLLATSPELRPGARPEAARPRPRDEEHGGLPDP